MLIPAEYKLTEMECPRRGRQLIKQVRRELFEHGRPLLEAIIKDVLKVNVISLHTDISTKTGERLIAFTLEERPVYRSN